MQKEKPNTADEKKKTEENKPKETEMNRKIIQGFTGKNPSSGVLCFI